MKQQDQKKLLKVPSKPIDDYPPYIKRMCLKCKCPTRKGLEGEGCGMWYGFNVPISCRTMLLIGYRNKRLKKEE